MTFLPLSFGSGADGAFNSSGTTSVAPTSGLVLKQYTSFTLGAGGIFTASASCRGLIIFSIADIIINGTLKMDGLALSSPASPMPILCRRPLPGPSVVSINSDRFDVFGFLGHANTGSALSNAAGVNGEYAGRGGSGGNGGHSDALDLESQMPAIGTYCGGQAGGQGGNSGGVQGGAGGAGGGVILLVAAGNITIGSAGILSAKGLAGGAGTFSGGQGSGGGGGGGGGVIAALYAASYTNSNAATGTSSLSCPGGAAGASSGGTTNPGGAGGQGTYLSQKIAMT